MDKGINDLYIKPSDMDRSKWRKMIGGNWSDRSSDSFFVVGWATGRASGL